MEKIQLLSLDNMKSAPIVKEWQKNFPTNFYFEQ